MPDTIEDRAVIITLRRKAPTEHVAKYRLRKDKPTVTAIGDRLAAWIAPSADALAEIEPAMPPGLNDRAEDVWESLLAVADLAGGPWPARARRAAAALSAEAEQEAAESLGQRLLADIRELFRDFTVSFMPSRELVTRLTKMDDAPWRDLELTTRALSDRLRPYKIAPRRDASGTTRGYRLEDFADAFGRYLPYPPSETVNTSASDADLRGRLDSSGASDTSNRQTRPTRQALTRGFDDLTDSDAPLGREWPDGSIGAAARHGQ